ncbi:hypothetical protein [Okeania hirsuta]|nr:hypothetical protein [Okeania hirsuta]
MLQTISDTSVRAALNAIESESANVSEKIQIQWHSVIPPLEQH